ncbi:hypothetical protein FC826_02990 [Clostridium botulinum]|uniref:Rad50/SbcC-type AAA domain-containing protein n=1 Tax=Clostridium botulinum TaxID=1491 RepID=A0A6B4GRT6_CLOBO|nr:AAA family ATPase [Clostridium sporogenes]NFD75839.1 hypothetical protein [Clostridium botulinum]MCW6091724.1 AAA family ATPase [Clostridium sporogenes]MCW6091733.1 AAA family ATPase [Clostridium sporogenes]NFD83748.1 hypothetical protein [Clostridium botulinum]NFE07720.1 hypothetical protein [Clostridium botulinum]
MKNRFQLRKLEFIGIESVAEIEFFDGLNVIYGPSNTGKSLILSAIEYAFGKGDTKQFKGIDELNKFDKIKVTIEGNDANKYIIEREIRDEKADIIVKNSNKNSNHREYRPKKPTQKKATISDFFLKLTSAEGMKIKTKQSGATCNFTFDKELLITSINEEKIISRLRSPFLTGQYTNIPQEISAFKLFISDSDDSGCKEIDDAKTYKNKLKAKEEILLEISNNIHKEIEILTDEYEETQSSTVMNKIADLEKLVENKNNELLGYMNEKKELINFMNEEKSRKIFSEELVIRFNMHKENLESDIDRLSFIVESEHYLHQLIDKNCPICNSHINEDSIQYLHQNKSVDMEDIKEAYVKEISKIIIQLRDVEKSITYHEDILTECSEMILLINNKILSLDKLIEETLNPELKLLQRELYELNKYIILKTKIEEKKLRIAQINNEYRELERKLNLPAPKNTYDKVLSDSDINNYERIIEDILIDWKYDKDISVLFNINTLDIAINNKLRISNGKGHRAIQAASMVIGLMKYLTENDKIHPGYVILDSPLLSYKEEENLDNDEKVSEKVQEAFFNSLVKCENMQIVVLENKEPTEFAKKNANVIEFTKNPLIGRSGLL